MSGDVLYFWESYLNPNIFRKHIAGFFGLS